MIKKNVKNFERLVLYGQFLNIEVNNEKFKINNNRKRLKGSTKKYKEDLSEQTNITRNFLYIKGDPV